MSDRRDQARVWLPERARRTHHCRLCDTPLYEDEYEAHVRMCVKRNEQRLYEESPVRKLPIIYDKQLGDPEYDAFVRNLPKEWIHEDGTWQESGLRPRKAEGAPDGRPDD